MEFKNSECHTWQKKVMKQTSCGVQGFPAHQGLNTWWSNSTWNKALLKVLGHGDNIPGDFGDEIACRSLLRCHAPRACDVRGEHHGWIGRVGCCFCRGSESHLLLYSSKNYRICFLPRKGGEKTENNLYLTILEGVTNRPRIFELCLHSYSSFWQGLIRVVCL